jgi:hypothetical protein
LPVDKRSIAVAKARPLMVSESCATRDFTLVLMTADIVISFQRVKRRSCISSMACDSVQLQQALIFLKKPLTNEKKRQFFAAIATLNFLK